MPPSSAVFNMSVNNIRLYTSCINQYEQGTTPVHMCFVQRSLCLPVFFHCFIAVEHYLWLGAGRYLTGAHKIGLAVCSGEEPARVSCFPHLLLIPLMAFDLVRGHNSLSSGKVFTHREEAAGLLSWDWSMCLSLRRLSGGQFYCWQHTRERMSFSTAQPLLWKCFPNFNKEGSPLAFSVYFTGIKDRGSQSALLLLFRVIF
jgi:hypothetical protein